MSRQNLLYVITDLETGGVPLHLARLAAHARQSGWQVTVCCLAPAGPVARLLEEAGVPAVGLDATGPADWRVIERLAALMGDHRPDLAHALLFHANMAARLACVLSGFPTRRLICEIQTVEIERGWHLWADRWTQRWCRVIVGNSPSVIGHLRRAARIHPSRLQLILGGVDTERIDHAKPMERRRLGIENDDPVVLWSGRLDPVKGLDELIEAFARVVARRPANLVLAGEGAYRPKVQRLIRQSGLSGRVFMLGARTDVPALLKSADLFVLPSRTEGLPNALLEAMAAGLPCVAADVPGCRDVIVDRIDGLLTPSGDAARLADAMAELLGDRELAPRLGRAARAKARRDFRLDRCLQSYLALYTRLMTER